MKVRYTKRALGDLARIEAYTRKHSPRGAARIGARLRIRIDELEQFPEQAAALGGGLRQLVVTQTPYVVIYRVRAEIQIVTIIHTSQKHRS